jgi:TetR/AcrR family transcriptional regulator, regulator of cefoperazone and chloramphenicol sensitivity
MNSMPNETADPAVALGRGAQARTALLQAATQVFAQKGFAKASTREICQLADVNVAAIHYYFGDKEGLYRQVFLQPVEQILAASQQFDAPHLTFEQSMLAMYKPFLDTLRRGDVAMQSMQLHFREQLEPSGVMGELFYTTITPHFEAIKRLVTRHLGLAEADEDVVALASVLLGLVHDYLMSCDVHTRLAPTLCNDGAAIDRMQTRLVRYACALLADEAAQRQVNSAVKNVRLDKQVGV